MHLLSIIVPCYNEELAIPIFYRAVKEAVKRMDDFSLKILFVDDGSCDQTLLVMKRLSEQDEAVEYLSFSRNFGKEAAVLAGLEHAAGDLIAVMDADLQDPPNLLPEMYSLIVNEKYDCVATCRSNRKGEPIIRSFFARMFYKLMAKISNTEIVDGARDYRMMTRQYAEAVCSMHEYNRFLKGIYGWVGFKTKWLQYENVERCAGKTKWSFFKLLKYSIEGIIAFSTAPLEFVAGLGMTFCVLSFIALCIIFIRALFWGDPVSGWPSLVCIITLLGGIQLLCLGIVGLYLSKTYLETKGRPIYIVKEKSVNLHNISEGDQFK